MKKKDEGFSPWGGDAIQELNHLVELSDGSINAAQGFSKAYAKSAGISFRQSRSAYGTKGEMAVHAYLSGNAAISKPDLEIYEIGSKRHGFDLSSSADLGFHVKTCDFERYPDNDDWSFVFEKTDGLALWNYGPEDCAFFCVAMDERFVLVRWKVSMEFLACHNLFKKLRSRKKFAENKLAVYDRDLRSLKIRYA